MTDERTSEGEKLDLLWGAEEIAREIRRSTRQVNHMLATGALIGAKKIAGRWCITRSALRALFDGEKQEAA